MNEPTPSDPASSSPSRASSGSSGSVGAPSGQPPSSKGPGAASDLFGLLLSVALFGYFGFFGGWAHERTVDGELLPMVVLFKWTLRICAVAFALAAVLVLARRREADLVAGVIGLLGAAAFAVVGIWDLLHPEYNAGLAEVVLLLFAAWNGLVAWQALRSWMRRGAA